MEDISVERETLVLLGKHRLSVSPAEFAEAFGCTRQHVHNMIARGELRSVKLGGKRLIPVSAILELLNGGGQDAA